VSASRWFAFYEYHKSTQPGSGELTEEPTERPFFYFEEEYLIKRFDTLNEEKLDIKLATFTDMLKKGTLEERK
jgi:hypothetical protein